MERNHPIKNLSNGLECRTNMQTISRRIFRIYSLWVLLWVSLSVNAQITQGENSSQSKMLKEKFVNIKSLSNDFILDIKYATADNFLKQAVYDCGECYLREATAKALLAAQKEFVKRGYSLKLFDCYRPLSVQKKMWKILPGTHYVANPAKGSKHNRGAEVDLT